MSKLYYPTPDELQGSTFQDSKIWYRNNQATLVALFNSNEGRDLFCLESSPYPIIKVGANFIVESLQQDMGPGFYRSTFRTAPKYSNLFRSRLKYTRHALNRVAFMEMMGWDELKLDMANAVFASDFFNPQPDEEETSVDGQVSWAGSNQAWGTITGQATGTSVADSADSGNMLNIVPNASGNWNQIVRSFFLYDTSTLTSVATKVSATHGIVCPGKNDNMSQSVSLVDSNPASDTALVVADYDKVLTTSQANPFTIASVDDGGANYNIHTLNSTGLGNVSLTGITKFGGRASGDPATEPSHPGEEITARVGVFFADKTGINLDPKLTVVYTLPFTPRAMMF